LILVRIVPNWTFSPGTNLFSTEGVDAKSGQRESLDACRPPPERETEQDKSEIRAKYPPPHP
jgi:hypothetical protein